MQGLAAVGAVVEGFAPPYASCAPAYEQDEEGGRGWRDWFGWGDNDDEPPRDPAREAEAQPVPEED